MDTVRRRNRSGATWVLGAIVLAGCGSGGGEDPPSAEVVASPTASPSVTAPTAEPTTTDSSPSPTPSPVIAPPAAPPDVPKPERSEEMSRNDQAGSVAAAELYFALMRYAVATGDLADRDAMSHPECAGCAMERELILKNHAAGDYLVYDSMEVRQIWVSPPADGLSLVTLELEPREVTAEPGETEPPVVVTVIQYELRWDEDGWVVHRIGYGGPEDVPEWPSGAPSPGPGS